MPDNKVQIIYKLENIDPDDGVDVFEIAPVLMSFGDLIRGANEALGLDQKIDVRVKPFRAGSWIAEFVLQNQPILNLLNYASTQEGQNLMTILALLGLNAKEGVVGLATLIRFTKGVVNNFRKSQDGKTVTYVNPSGEEMTVELPTHKLAQSPTVQGNFYNCVVIPFDKFPSTSAVSIQVNVPSSQPQVFTEADKPYFQTYAGTELLEDVEDNVSVSKGVFVKPKRGPYSGEEKAYSFVMGDTVMWPVTIEDESFLTKLKSGEVRPYAEDVLKVDMEIHQKKDSNNKVITSYSIVKVIDYLKYEKPRQINLGMEQDELQDQ